MPFANLLGSDTFAVSYVILNENFDRVRTDHQGPTEPANLRPLMTWADTATLLLKRRSLNNDAWIVVAKIGVTFGGLLPTEGGALTGPLDMGGNSITNLGLGSGLAAARVQELNLKAPINAPEFTGDARVLQDPAGGDSIPRRSWTDGRYLKKSGDTMTGILTLSQNAVSGLQAISFQQLAAFNSFNTTSGHSHDGVNSRKVRGVDLNSGAIAEELLLASDGSSGAEWLEFPKVGNMRNQPIQIIGDQSSTTAWATRDIAAEVALDPASGQSRGAFLRAEFQSRGARRMRLEVRRQSAFVETFYEPWHNDPEEDSLFSQVVFPVPLTTSKTFDWRAIRNGSAGSPAPIVNVWFLGYF